MNVKNVSWDDLAVELGKASEAFEKTKLSFESLSRTYQELIDYCEEFIEGVRGMWV